MTAPTVFGRKLPVNDFEGDDFTPGAGGKWVTCGDTSVGRAVSYATNGRIDKDGKVYRAALPGRDPDGITLDQAAIEVANVAALKLVQPNGWGYKETKAWLTGAKGLMVGGWYEHFPRAFRYQANAAFNHFIWISHFSPTSGYRVWDALNPDTTAYGRWIPEAVVRAFMESGDHGMNYYVAYVPLQPASNVMAGIVRRLPWAV